jgi:hypothetical protein
MCPERIGCQVDVRLDRVIARYVAQVEQAICFEHGLPRARWVARARPAPGRARRWIRAPSRCWGRIGAGRLDRWNVSLGARMRAIR